MSGAVEPNDVVQVVMMGVTFEHFKAWINGGGMHVVRMQFDPEDIPTYSVVLK